jgi:benzoylformate decarboxylase
MDALEHKTAPRTVRDATLVLLRSLGMTTIFGNPGSTELPLFKQWSADFRYILGLQEACVVCMADGYAQATQNASIVNLHSAAGLGNALGSVFTAYRNQTPMVITAGQQTRAMQPTEPHLYATDPAAFPKPYVKWSCEPARAQDVPAAIAHAYYLAMQKPCGPTFVSIPIDDWEAETKLLAPGQVCFEFAPDPIVLQQIADALNRSKQPALVVGPSVDRDGAWESVVALAERTSAAVWESPFAGRASFPEDHPLFAGFLPPVRQLLAQKLAAYDVVIVLGAPIFTYHIHTDGPFVPEGIQLFQIIDDPDAAARSPLGTSLLSTLRLGLSRLLDLVELVTRPRPTPWVRPDAPAASDPIQASYVMHTIAQVMPTEAFIIEEAPSYRNVLHDYLPIRKSNSFSMAVSGGMGYGLPAAVGVALGNPSRRVICLVGDGSSMYSVQALWTAAQHSLPITFVVFNNRGYGSLKAFSKMFDTTDFPGVDLPDINICKIARGYGCEALHIEKATELAPALVRSFTSKGPVVLDVLIDSAISVLY